MTTVQRAYIRPSYEQAVDDGCLEWKSVPMAVIDEVVKVSHGTNDYNGIKQIYNPIPPRPMNLNALATSIARINNLPYQKAVPEITKKLIDEETGAVRKFIEHLGDETEVEGDPFHQHYKSEHPVQSSSGTRLGPIEGHSANMAFRNIGGPLERKSVLLGDLQPSRGIVPFNYSLATQTEWINSKEEGYKRRDIQFGYIDELDNFGHYGVDKGRREIHTQTLLTKPQSKRHISSDLFVGKERFYEHAEDRFGTMTGTQTSRLNRMDHMRRAIEEGR